MTHESEGGKMREFGLGQILSVTTGKLLSETAPPITGVYEILSYMVGEDVYTHQLGRCSEECAPEILRQHPQLANVDASGVTTETWRTWIAAQKKRFGDRLSILPLALGLHLSIDPLKELEAMVGDDKPIIVVTKD